MGSLLLGVKRAERRNEAQPGLCALWYQERSRGHGVPLLPAGPGSQWLWGSLKFTPSDFPKGFEGEERISGRGRDLSRAEDAAPLPPDQMVRPYLPPALCSPPCDPKPSLCRPLTLAEAVLGRGAKVVCLAHHTGSSPKVRGLSLPQTWAPPGPDFPWPSACPGSYRPWEQTPSSAPQLRLPASPSPAHCWHFWAQTLSLPQSPLSPRLAGFGGQQKGRCGSVPGEGRWGKLRAAPASPWGRRSPDGAESPAPPSQPRRSASIS